MPRSELYLTKRITNMCDNQELELVAYMVIAPPRCPVALENSFEVFFSREESQEVADDFNDKYVVCGEKICVPIPLYAPKGTLGPIDRDN